MGRLVCRVSTAGFGLIVLPTNESRIVGLKSQIPTFEYVAMKADASAILVTGKGIAQRKEKESATLIVMACSAREGA